MLRPLTSSELVRTRKSCCTSVTNACESLGIGGSRDDEGTENRADRAGKNNKLERRRLDFGRISDYIGRRWFILARSGPALA